MQMPTRLIVSAALAGAGLVGAAEQATGAPSDWALNGTYTATSNGEWSKTNDVFTDQASIRSTWTITSTCSYPGECTGTVTSDWGWTAPIYQKSGVWYVKRTVDNWQPCPDGSAAAGLQVYRFFTANPDATAVDPASTTLMGDDQTTGLSGSCGSSKVLFISMPFKLVKTG
jgi:Flp pilus assembly protein TadG